MDRLLVYVQLRKTRSFPLRTFSVNLSKSTGNCGCGFFVVSYSSEFVKIGLCHKSDAGGFSKFEKYLFCRTSLTNSFKFITILN